MAVDVMVAVPASAALPMPDAAQLLGRPAFVEARRVASWIRTSSDNSALQYIIIDKINARLFVFDRDGKLQASTPVLIGLARGDDSPPGIGNRQLSAITPAERITPAGRFISGAGEDIGGRDLIWIDYGSAIALHRASDRKPGMGAQSRVERLSAVSASERRVSLGCVNVSTAFYDRFIKPTFGTSQGVIYVLPETRSATVEFHIPVTAAG